jgi:hypothetical protein
MCGGAEGGAGAEASFGGEKAAASRRTPKPPQNCVHVEATRSFHVDTI